MQLGVWGFAGAFLGALALSAALTPLALRVALARGALDVPGEHKSHTSPVPYFGGLAIAAAFTLAVAVAAVIRPPVNVEEILVILGVALALSVLGLLDDLRGLGPLVRLLAQTGAGLAVWAVGAGTVFAPWPWLNLLITVVWIVGVTNAINLLDNMDGLSAGIAGIAAVAFFGIAAVNGQFLVAGLAAALAGCAFGFLRHNFHPAKIYMGDAGSMFLGFLLAVVGIRLRLVETPQVLSVFVPVLVLGVAILDTTLVTVDRIRYGHNPLRGGRDHVSHRLIAIGLPVRAAVALIYAAGISLGWLAALLSRLDLTSGLMLVGFVLAAGVFAFALLATVPVYENSRQRRRMMRLVDESDDGGAA
ncbi:undecaprenyl/decaprenyl-phosphate alpha-N-acetylglucosaminyl 1-phosphate transferase [Egibacter rhizosphaerae]|uniref:Undecaprenyl/decaprenyl-phosphate alpha-N-acetylglucosaminyl 1-phosphate transferase n=1 Tax=Egibacter rhizosphaerae TaxID=1670831 RepID=A0A411YIB1_9ACTN|nr:MraY family glycosyltransferase [Egibacter rhizosphaerae]QBI20826.1 undecaprenyl/decaprenyl-phosphate alpha-N-acetylglucosaminyl 1-phosphate transferase [Egibacter rhizosphaerae]